MRFTYLLRFLLPAFALLALCGCDNGSGGSKGSGYVRVLNVSPGYDSLDLSVDNQDDDDGDASALTGVGYGTVSDYAKLKAGTYTFKFKRNGVSGTLQTLADQKLTDDSRTLYVAYGSSGNFGVQSISEDVDEPDDGDTYVRVLNAAEGVGSLNVYFTESSVDLDNVSADFSSVGSGVKLMDSGTYRLRITGSSIDDVRLDIPEITLENRKVVTLILTSTQGGVLVNAVLLPQEGEVSLLKNPNARIRGAVGISSGTMTTIRVGTVTLLSNATAGAIGSSYTQVTAGDFTPTISVDGTAMSTQSQTLTAGGDYTLLAWNDADGTHTTLITDDNRLPTGSSKAKMRLINGMSGFGDPISLAIDYSPIAEGVALGAASDSVEVDSGTDYQMDVYSSLTTTNVLTKTSVTLQSGTVYTLFLAGSATSDQVSGILRKDR